jgi:hypothetical protein
MPIEIRDTDGGLGVIITGSGNITEEEYIDALTKHLTQDEEKFKQIRYSLSDYTKTLKVDVSNKALELIANYCQTVAKINPDIIVVHVTNHALVYGLAKMWEVLTNNTKWEKMVFRDRSDAEAWIRKRIEEKYGIDNLTFN